LHEKHEFIRYVPAGGQRSGTPTAASEETLTGFKTLLELEEKEKTISENSCN